MKKKSLLFSLFLALGVGFAVAGTPSEINIIPQPTSVVAGNGSFTFHNFTIAYPSNKEAKEVAQLLADELRTTTDLEVNLVAGNSPQANIKLLLTDQKNMNNEAYRLIVDPRGATITACGASGLFYGTRTLLQLLPSQIASKTKVKGVEWSTPMVAIDDSPRFGWRGMMLDVGRHFFTKEEVMAYIDQMAQYKMNRFHWHLTDDQGWRLEIEGLPRLTQIGAWRAPRVGDWWTRQVQGPDEKATYGGFYTKEDVAQVIEYARRRFVSVVPEIDVPGHSLAALVAYPELACLQAPPTINVGNKFYGIDENSLCIGAPQTMKMMDIIFSQVAQMFPFEYIHIGGDECYKGFWAKCPKCQKLMADHKITDVNELQSYFIRQMEALLKAKGKKIIGWDEISEGGLAPEATVMSWRGMEGGVQAAKENHHVIMTPNSHCYLDLYQGEPSVEPNTYSMCRLWDSYHFPLLPDGVREDLILGGQGNLWAESVPTFRHAQYMSWPRGWALAEVLWSDTTNCNWANFVNRVESHFLRAEQGDVNYSRSMYNAIVRTTIDSTGQITVFLSSEVPGLELYYTFDNTLPDTHALRYSSPVAVPLNASRLTVNTFRNGKPMGAILRLEVGDLKSRAASRVRAVGNL
ncbi:MAG: family 20 glycosylhydrolase [Mucinivorans sp.]